jgi:hypothetical protein
MTDIRFDLAHAHSHSHGRGADRAVFRLLVVLTYPLFLVAAVISRFAPHGRGLMARPATRISVFSQARQACEASIAFAFQG